VRSFLDTFPHASLWTTEFHEMLLIGSFSRSSSMLRLAARFSQPEVATAVREVGIASPAALLATWVTDRAGLSAMPRRASGDRRPTSNRVCDLVPEGLGRPAPVARFAPSPSDDSLAAVPTSATDC
jgi:hypothetical protein